MRLPPPLEFGTAIHAALQVYYDPEMWDWDREVVNNMALLEFVKVNRAQLLRYEELKGTDELMRIEFNERHELGIGMLKHYFEWAPNNDYFRPVKVETEFEVPIPVPDDMVGRLPFGFSCVSGYLHFKGEPVVYQGRIDMLVQDDKGRYWLDDHKTAGQMREDVVTHLEMDEQVKSYGWAFQQMLGIRIAGLIYNELYKGLPSPPPMNKTQRQGRWYSVNKQQDTSYELYLETVKENDRTAYEAGLYDEMLEYLKNNPKHWFRRSVAMFTQAEYEILGYQICLEAIDMLNDPLIYPNPSRFKCGYCMMRPPCLSIMEGNDPNWILNEHYVQRPSSTDEPGTEVHVGLEPAHEV